MRQPYSITPALIHRAAREALVPSGDWKPWRRSVSVHALLDLLLLMAATGASLFATARRFFHFSHETARRAVRANLPARDALTAGLLRALHRAMILTRRDRRRHWVLAIDTHDVPYYGRPVPHLIGGPKKQGTKRFFGYATAVLLHRRHRYTVALTPLLARQMPHEVVRILLDQVAACGLRIRGVTLDSAFDSGEVLLLLQERGLAYTIPLRRKGRGGNARNRCFEGRHRLVRWAQWKTDKTSRRVRTRVVLWRGAHRTWALAYGGWGGPRARGVYRQAGRQRAIYRRRFGIETSYRQKNQAQARTTSRSLEYRLLLEGVAYLLRQVWVALTQQIARRQWLGAGAWVGALPFESLLAWLADEVAVEYPERRSIPLGFKGNCKARSG
jgi:hypothetical protein